MANVVVVPDMEWKERKGGPNNLASPMANRHGSIYTIDTASKSNTTNLNTNMAH